MLVLKGKDLSVNEILGYFTIKQATLSSHLSLLRKAGLVSFSVKGKQRIYKLNQDSMKAFVKYFNGLLGRDDINVKDEIIVRRKSD